MFVMYSLQHVYLRPRIAAAGILLLVFTLAACRGAFPGGATVSCGPEHEVGLTVQVDERGERHGSGLVIRVVPRSEDRRDGEADVSDGPGVRFEFHAGPGLPDAAPEAPEADVEPEAPEGEPHDPEAEGIEELRFAFVAHRSTCSGPPGGARLETRDYHLRGAEIRIAGHGTVPVVVRGPDGGVLTELEVDLSRQETRRLEW